jgi:hypothetical protein
MRNSWSMSWSACCTTSNKEATLQLCTTRITLSASREIGNGTTSDRRTRHTARNFIPYFGWNRNDNPLIPLPASRSDADRVWLRGSAEPWSVSNRRQNSSCSLKQTSKWTNAKESKQINEPTPKKAKKQTNRQATGMQNVDSGEE